MSRMSVSPYQNSITLNAARDPIMKLSICSFSCLFVCIYFDLILFEIIQFKIPILIITRLNRLVLQPSDSALNSFGALLG